MDVTVDEILGRFDDSKCRIGSKEGMSGFLDILSRNPELELLEALSIFTLYPEGKMLRTFGQWKREYGRNVKSDSVGIKTIEFVEDEESEDDIPEIVPKIITKFDVSQTLGKAVPVLADCKIRNKKCQEEFKKILSEVLCEEEKQMELPLNSMAGICSGYVIMKHYGITDAYSRKHLQEYDFQKMKALNHFLSNLFELLGRTFYKLQQMYENLISQFIKEEPEKAVIKQEKQPVKVKKEVKCLVKEVESVKIATSQLKKEVPGRMSLLSKLRLKTKEARIYNQERNSQ